MPPRKFSVWLNHEYLTENPDKAWLKEVSSKAVKKSIENAGAAYQGFWKHGRGFPKYKKKNKRECSMYFVRNGKDQIIPCERHRLKIPTLGWVRLKEKGYIPESARGYCIISGNVSVKAGRYYVSVVIDTPEKEKKVPCGEGLGIDLGVKDLAICSDGRGFSNINKTKKMKKLEKKLRRESRRLSRKYEDLKKRETAMKRELEREKAESGSDVAVPGKDTEESKNGKGKVSRKNIDRQILKVQRIHKKMADIRTDHINKTVNAIVKPKPSYITVEDLNVSGMMKNRHLSKAIASQKFYEFNVKLRKKCNDAGIELRKVDRFYPSSRMCHHCGRIKKDLKLSDRVYICPCGYREDRDYNASLNLRDSKVYVLA